MAAINVHGSLRRAAGGARREGQVHHLPRASLADQIEVIDSAVADLPADADDEGRPYHRNVVVDMDCRIGDALLKGAIGLDARGRRSMRRV
jgi:hypothetical protein